MKIEFFKLVDKIIGTLLCVIIWVVDKIIPVRKKKIERIVIVKLWALGDSLMTLPMVKALRKKYPNAKISVLCRKVNYQVYDQKFVDEILFFDGWGMLALLLHFKRYDIAIDTDPWLRCSALLNWYLGKKRVGYAGQIRSILYNYKIRFDRKKHMVQHYLEMGEVLGAKGERKLLPLPYSHADQTKVLGFLKKNKITRRKPIIGIGIGVGPTGKIRLWRNDRWAKVCDALVKGKKAQIVFVGTKDDNALIEEVQRNMKSISFNTAGRFSIPQSAYLLSLCDLTIAPDTGTMHLAAAMGTRTLGLFGPNLPSLWSPFGRRNDYIFHKTPGAPLIRNEKGLVPEKDPYDSMGKIKVEEVLKKARKMLS